MRSFATLLLVVVFIGSSTAQSNAPDADLKSIDGIIHALYDAISGEAGQPRNWERFKNLFTADARLIPTFKDKEGKAGYRALTPAEYVERYTKNVSSGFYENELSRVTEEYGNIVHVFSTYETREKKDGPVTMRGINSIQLLKTAERYYVMNVFWSAENNEQPLPAKYLSR